MDPVFLWVESSAFSVWARESTSVFAFPTFLAGHALGMACVVGINVAVSLRLLGVTPGFSGTELKKVFPLFWVGVWLAVISGTILLIAYPTKALTNPFFYAKLVFVGLGFWQVRMIENKVLGNPDLDIPPSPKWVRLLAVSSMVCWFGVIATGRFLAYTYGRLLVNW